MSMLPLSRSNGSGGLYTVEEQENFMGHLINHENDMVENHIT